MCNKAITLTFICFFLISSHDAAFANNEYFVDFYNRDSLSSIDWVSVPTQNDFKGSSKYDEEDSINKSKRIWLYNRTITRGVGDVQESISKKNEFWIYGLVPGDAANSSPNSCEKYLNELTNTYGKPNVTIDKSNTKKALIDDKSDLTMDWSTYSVRHQWNVESNRIDLFCLGFGTEMSVAKSDAFFAIAVSSQNALEELKPIQWIKCNVESSVHFNDGRISKGMDAEWVLGIDFNENSILRSDNTLLDSDAHVSDRLIEFKVGKKDNPSTIVVNRTTGSLVSEKSISSDGIRAKSYIDGECEKFDNTAKKF